MNKAGELFDAWYYANNCGEPYERTTRWLAFFGGIAQEIQTRLNPTTVLDAGCAKGFLVEALRDRGVEAWGVDISEYAINQVYAPVAPYCKVASITEPFESQYDLIVTVEVLEHMPPSGASKAIRNLCAHTNTILFSSSPKDFAESTHFNVQPSAYWVKEFAYQGFFHDLGFDTNFLTPWAMLFRRAQRTPVDLAYSYEQNRERLRNENTDLRKKNVSLEEQLKYLERELQKTKKLSQEQQTESTNLLEVNKMLNAEIEALRSSNSWKITKPFRMIKSMFKKGA